MNKRTNKRNDRLKLGGVHQAAYTRLRRLVIARAEAYHQYYFADWTSSSIPPLYQEICVMLGQHLNKYQEDGMQR